MNYSKSDPLDRVINLWKNEPAIMGNIVRWQVEARSTADYVSFPLELDPVLQRMLKRKGIESLYSHQISSWEAIQAGNNTVIVTGTASGKSLCYHLPILGRCISDPLSRILCVYPTKALTQDQHKILTGYQAIIQEEELEINITSAIYDGDTPAHLRSAIRSKTNILLTNPDMLHLSILPHHTVWVELFKNLRFVVIDEMHTYRGVFGAHLANIIRRLKRVASFYGSHPQWIFTSATISNPVELAEKLIEEPVTCIDADGSPKGPRHFMFYNPPIIHPEIGARKSASSEAIRLTSDLVDYGIQTIVFTRSRRSVEIMLRNLRQSLRDSPDQARGYRSGYLPGERRKIERDLRGGQARVVVATNALELGVDIGGMDAAILVGYPGTIAATRQQAGRAGRRSSTALAIFVASASPLDQYLMAHPEYILGKNPERALINPDNILILLQHLRCAVFELPLRENESYGSIPDILLKEILSILQSAGEVHLAHGKFYWTADQYPAGRVSLRTSSPDRVLLQSKTDKGLVTIGEVDQPSALWMVHPGAIYLHEGSSFEVVELDLGQHAALLKPVESDFYTEPLRKTTLMKINGLRQDRVPGGEKNFGEVQVETRTIGFRRIQWHTNETLSQEPLDLPASQLRTTAYWLSLSEELVSTLRQEGLWVNDPINYGPNWDRQRNQVRVRDQFTCQMCGSIETGEAHHVHHKIPFRTFQSYLSANQLDNLVTLCSACHKKAEEAVRMRSGLAGLAYLLVNLAPLFIMCDITDLGADFDPQSSLTDGRPAVCIYDHIPAGIGLSEHIYEIDAQLLQNAYEVLTQCPCENGCPACVGPAGENGTGGKLETKAILTLLTGRSVNGISL